jgi:Kelch motif protein
MTGVVNVAGSCAQAGWSAGPDMPTVLVRAVGVYFQPDGNFYTMGGRTSDTAGSDFQHALQYSPVTNSWTQKPSTFPDNQMNNMACGVLTVSGTPQIYCVGGSAAGASTATGRVFSYNPVTDTPTTLTGDDWPGAQGTILPGGFAVANNKFYILGGFNINVGSTNQIWEFDPTAAVGAKWTQKTNTPAGIMYAPTCTINGIIYVGGASDFQGGTVVDTNTSFSFDPVANSIGSIAAIPRATGETRGLNFNGKMYVMGGGRVAPNPSNEVDIYDPDTNSWTTGAPFNNPRRNFPTDTDGTTHIWLSGGYDVDGLTPLASMEIFCEQGATPTPTPTATATATATATGTATATPSATGTVTPTPTVSPTPTPCQGRCSPTPRPRPTPAPRP